MKPHLSDLWAQAGGDEARFLDLMRAHGHMTEPEDPPVAELPTAGCPPPRRVSQRYLSLCPARCGSPIIWAVTEAGRRQALNPEPDPAGNVAAYRTGSGTWQARSLKAGELPARHEKRYMPHAAQCADLRASRKPPAQQPPGAAVRALPSGVVSMAGWLARHGRRGRR